MTSAEDESRAKKRSDSGVVPRGFRSDSAAVSKKLAENNDPKVQLVNKTARRISIERPGGEALILAPFGVFETRESATADLDLGLWIERGYLEKRTPLRDEEPAFEPSMMAGLIAILGGSALLGRALRSWVPMIVGVILVGLSVLPEVQRLRARRRERDASAETPSFRDSFWHAIGMLTVCVTGFGLPIAVLFLQTSLTVTDVLGQPARSLAFLALFALFVGAAATLPAMLFFLFTEQRRPVMKEQFHRDILRLDPALRTINEAERAYAPLLNEALHTRRGPLFFGPIIISTFLLSLGWVSAALPPHALVQRTLSASLVELDALFVPNRTPFTFAFLGTYFFSLNMVFRRYVRADLGPKAYSHIAVRIIIATILAWIASHTLGGLETLTGTGTGSATQSAAPAPVVAEVTPWHVLLLAFFIGIVPETGLAVLHDLMKTRLVSFFVPAMKARDPLTNLEGITLYDRARLLEEGIENIENLAHHNLIELVLRTRIPAPRLVDLVDQAILYLHVRDEPPEGGAEPDERSRTLERLKARGIRTATDLEQISFDADAYARLVADVGERIHLIVHALHDDEWMPQLRSWREFRKTYESIYRLEDLAQTCVPSRHPVSLRGPVGP